MVFCCSNTLISITLQTFLKHNCQHQIGSLLLLCKQGNVFDLFFQEHLKKKNKDKSDLLSSCYHCSCLIKKLLCYKEIFNNTSYIQEKNQNTLSFNPIFSHSRPTQSLKYIRRGLRSLIPWMEGAPPQLCWCSLRSQMSNQVFFSLFATLFMSSI